MQQLICINSVEKRFILNIFVELQNCFSTRFWATLQPEIVWKIHPLQMQPIWNDLVTCVIICEHA